MIKKILFCVLFFIISFVSFGQTILGKPLINKSTAKTAVNAGDINNIISYTNGNSNSVCVEANENTDATFTAPAGTYFDSVSFASFGNPTGSACNYTINSACHQVNSQSIVEDALLGKINTTIISASNTLFGDPCGGTAKKLYVKAHYAEPLCAGGAVTITGAVSTETNAYIYLWESSTTSSTAGFSTAAGTNNGQNYTTGVLTQDTWFRRKVITNSDTNISAVVLVKVNQRPTATLSGGGSICGGNSTSFTISFTGAGPFDLTYTDGVTPVSLTGITANPYTVNLTPTSSATYSLIALKGANCTATAADLTSSIIIKVVPSPTLASATQVAPVCAGSAASIAFTGLAPNVSTTISYIIVGIAGGAYSTSVGSAGTATLTTPVLTAAANGKILKITGIKTTSQSFNCNQTFSMDVVLVVNPDLTLGAASQESPVCEGSGAVIKLTGLLADSTSDITYAIAGVTKPTVTVVANSSGEASFTTLPLTIADNAQTLQITKSQLTVSPFCSKTFTVNTTLTVNPIPTINVSQSIAACSGVGFSVTPVNGTNGVVPAGTTYSWPLPIVTGGLSGGATGNGAATITGNLVNTTNNVQTATYTVTPKSGTCTGTPFIVTVTVNPVQTITAGTNANACQYSAMSTTLTLGDGITGATVTGLPTGITSSVSGNTLTISGTPTDIGVFTYNVSTTGNSCNPATTSGTITVGGGNNIISYANGNSNSVCIEADENTDATFTAPAGTYFDTVSFASFGTPTGSACNYAINNSCHQVNSQPIVESALLGKTNTITIQASNAIFGDPCGGTFKKLSATAHYSEPICAGGTAGIITGSVPVENGAYTYLWESSTTSSTTGFGTAAGTNNGQNYSPGVLTQDTWFRRRVLSNSCSNFSTVVLVKVNPRPTSVLTGATTICVGSSANLSVALTGTAPWNLTYTDGTTPVSVTGITANPYIFSVSPSVQKTYTISALSDSKCTAIAADRTGSALIKLNQRPTSVLSGGGETCDGTYRALSVALTGTAPWQFTYSDGTTSTTQAGVFTNPYIFYVNPASDKTYTITALKDSKCTAVAADMTGSAAVTVVSRPTSIISGGGSVCYGDSSSFTVTFTGTGPWDFSYSDGGAPVSLTGITTNPYTVNITPVSSRVYRVTALKDSKCTAIAADMTGSVIIGANPIPTLTGASVGGTVCAGSRALIRLTGLLTNAVSVISYTIDGVPKPDATVATGSSTSTGGFSTVPLTAADNGKILRITGIKNTTQTPYCSQTFAIDVTLAVYPTLTLTGASQAAPVCEGSGAIINLTGLIPNNSYTTFYSIGGTAQNFLTVTANASGEASFTTAALTAANNNQTLEITRIQDVASPFCTQIVSISTPLKVNPSPTLTNAFQALPLDCEGSQASIGLTGLLANSYGKISYKIDGVQQPDATYYANNAGQGSFLTEVLNMGYNGKILEITKITNILPSACSQTFAVTATLGVKPFPTLSGLSQAAPVCAGSGAVIKLTGLLPNVTTLLVYAIGSTNQPAALVTADASGNGSFTTSALTTANNNQILQIAGVAYPVSLYCGTSVGFPKTLILAVHRPPSITTQSTTSSICAGNNTSFSIVASGGGLTYQWQVSTNGGSTFTNLSDDSVYSNVTTAILNITAATEIMDSYQYQCVVTGTCSPSLISNPVILTVIPKLTNVIASITLQPTCTAPTATITVSDPLPASGLTYSLDGSNYTNTTGVFDNLSPGSYTVWVKNSSGCLMTTPAPIVVAIAGIKTWTGNTNNDWNDPANWNPVTASAPSDSDCILIPDVTGFLNKPIVSAGNVGSAYAIVINNGGSVIVYGDATLKVTNNVTVAPTGLLEFMNNASLVQKTDVANTGNIIYHRTTTPVRRYDYTHWSSPVSSSNFTLHTLSPNTLGDKYYSYDPVVGWVINYNGTLNMTPGMGYIVRAPQNYDINVAATYPASFTGVPNNGTIEVTGIVASKWVLLGNPYPSAIFADAFMDLNHSGALYFWTHNSPPSSSIPGDGKYNYTNADYAIYNYTGGVGIGDPGGSPTTPTGMIASGVAFFLNAGSSDNIVFNNDMREIGNNGQFFKTTKESLLEKNRIWLNMTNTGGAFKQLLVGYIEGASNNWDLNYDAVTINGNSYIDFYSINDTSKLTIQGRALPFDITDRIPLGYKTTIAGDFTIAIDHADGLFSNQAVYLEDKLTDAVQDLRAGNYTFTTAIGTFADRFTLSYTKKTLGTGDFEDLENSVLVSVKEKAIKVTSAKETISEVKIYDISGSLLYHKKKVGSNELQIQNLQSGNQVLLVKVILENGYNTTKKIIFQ